MNCWIGGWVEKTRRWLRFAACSLSNLGDRIGGLKISIISHSLLPFELISFVFLVVIFLVGMMADGSISMKGKCL